MGVFGGSWKSLEALRESIFEQPSRVFGPLFHILVRRRNDSEHLALTGSPGCAEALRVPVHSCAQVQ